MSEGKQAFVMRWARFFVRWARFAMKWTRLVYVNMVLNFHRNHKAY